jgi:hypothetical protein
LKLKFDELLSSFAINFNLRRYSMVRGQNRLVAGVLIYQTRSELSYSCRGGRFRNLRTPCRTGVTSTAPFGVDPVFKRGSDIFDIDTADSLGAFYNATRLADDGGAAPDIALHVIGCCLMIRHTRIGSA